MGNSRDDRAERLRKALRENLKRRKAPDGGSGADGMARRSDRLEPRLDKPANDAKADTSGDG